MRVPVPRSHCPRRKTAIPPLVAACAVLLALPPPALAQSVKTVVVPSGSGVVVAPRSARRTAQAATSGGIAVFLRGQWLRG
ncbi:hypothetical protein, partial [Roseomonas mucosa]|uniref:hypothetical protein n=1 Tax=Roseomonas mucosa TaxID=207340 RepID=UPI0039F049F1